MPANLFSGTHCPVQGSVAWYYPDSKPAAKEIKNYVAFWKGVEVEA